MKKILILANSASGLYDFRNELVLELLKEFEVFVSLPDEEKVPALAAEGCTLFHTGIDRRGINPVRDLKLLFDYLKLLRNVRPDVVLTYTIKPNIYGGICCRIAKTPYITNITGLGSVFEKGGLLQKIVVSLYRAALRKAACVFFQNGANRAVFDAFNIHGRKSRLVPGSGVNLDRHRFMEYPANGGKIIFLYVGRVMKEKGIDELLYAAREIHGEYENAAFKLVGSYEDDYADIIGQYEKEGILEHIGYQKDIAPFYMEASAVLMPSYHEGMSNVILEAAASARPVIASLIPGCREGFDDGVTGLGCPPRDKEALYGALKKFMGLSHAERARMGKNARKKMEDEFDRRHVVRAYMEEINGITEGENRK